MNFHDANGDSGLSPACTAPKPARKLLSESVAVPRQRRVKAAGWQAPSSTFTLYPGAHDLQVRSHTAASPDDVVSPRVVRTEFGIGDPQPANPLAKMCPRCISPAPRRLQRIGTHALRCGIVVEKCALANPLHHFDEALSYEVLV